MSTKAPLDHDIPADKSRWNRVCPCGCGKHIARRIVCRATWEKVPVMFQRRALFGRTIAERRAAIIKILELAELVREARRAVA